MELITICLNCGIHYRWDNKVSTTGMPDCPACGFNNQTGKRGSEKTGKYPEGLAGMLLCHDYRGDDAVEELLTLASQSDRKSLAIVEESLVFLAGKNLNYFTPGPRILTGAEVYGSKSYSTLLKSLTNKARKKYLLDNAAETQEEIIHITGHIEYNAQSFFNKIRKAGGQEALKIVQLLDTHVKVQARLINMAGVPGRRKSIKETHIYFESYIIAAFGVLGGIIGAFSIGTLLIRNRIDDDLVSAGIIGGLIFGFIFGLLVFWGFKKLKII